MEAVEDEGLTWRVRFEEKLEALNIQSIIPNNYEELLKGMSSKEYKALKATNPTKYIGIMREIIEQDLSFVEQSDFIICKWDGDPMGGTVSEASHAVYSGVPCYLVTGIEPQDINGWFFGCFDKVFKTEKALFSFLKKEYK